eukprot:TRINITY_DN30176_c0_g1_i1.p1 TRINITY_DN30176_c0_g1~~TRINITY_DN30176_c0_g1_i1.p1  ORF type:complete len:291 (-),score=36.51 TRINITY_DN30176_c0_g1_i1:423-1295(-)
MSSSMYPYFLCNVAGWCFNIYASKAAGKNIGRLSAAVDHVALPAGPAFAIWGLIYLWTGVFVIAQFFPAAGLDGAIAAITPYFVAAQFVQALWVFCFTSLDPDKVGKGGDIYLWVSIILLVGLVYPYMKAVEAAAELPRDSTGYWFAYGISINAAWVLLAAGLSINQIGRGLGWEGLPLMLTALFVVAATVGLELWITGFVGEAPFGSPTAFLSVATWAFFWVFMNLRKFPQEEDGHTTRLLPLYGSNFISFYKWMAFLLMIGAAGGEYLLLTRGTGSSKSPLLSMEARD